MPTDEARLLHELGMRQLECIRPKAGIGPQKSVHRCMLDDRGSVIVKIAWRERRAVAVREARALRSLAGRIPNRLRVPMLLDEIHLADAAVLVLEEIPVRSHTRCSDELLGCSFDAIQSVSIDDSSGVPVLSLDQELSEPNTWAPRSKVLLRQALESARFREVATRMGRNYDLVVSHGDLARGNVLYSAARGEPAGEVVVVDWEQAGLAMPHRDLASMLVSRALELEESGKGIDLLNPMNDSLSNLLTLGDFPLEEIAVYLAIELCRKHEFQLRWPGRITNRRRIRAALCRDWVSECIRAVEQLD